MTRDLPATEIVVASHVHQAPEHWLDGLDPEWIEIWNAHGGRHCQAEQVSIFEVRKNPAAYSFTYPTWTGKCSVSHDVQKR